MLSIPALPPVSILFISRFLRLQIEFWVFLSAYLQLYHLFCLFFKLLTALFHWIGFYPPCSRFVLHCKFLQYLCLCMVIPSCFANFVFKTFFPVCSLSDLLLFGPLVFFCFSWHCLRYNFCYLCCFPAAAISFFASIFATAVAVKILHSAQGTIG